MEAHLAAVLKRRHRFQSLASDVYTIMLHYQCMMFLGLMFPSIATRRKLCMPQAVRKSVQLAAQCALCAVLTCCCHSHQIGSNI